MQRAVPVPRDGSRAWCPGGSPGHPDIPLIWQELHVKKAVCKIMSFAVHRPFWKACRLFAAQCVLEQESDVVEAAEALALRGSCCVDQHRGCGMAHGHPCAPGEPAGHIHLNQVGRSHR